MDGHILTRHQASNIDLFTALAQKFHEGSAEQRKSLQE